MKIKQIKNDVPTSVLASLLLCLLGVLCTVGAESDTCVPSNQVRAAIEKKKIE